MNAPRLINRCEVLTQLLAAIAAVPPGQRLHIPALRDALINQGDVIKGIETLIAAGELDPATLRPVASQQPTPRAGRKEKPARNWGDRPSGRDLGRRLEEEGSRRGLLPAEVSRQAFGNLVQIFSMRNGTRPVHRATLLKAETWLAKAVEPAPESPPAPATDEAAAPERVDGAALFDAVCREAARRRITRQQASQEIFGNVTQLYGLKSATWRLSETSLAKVETWLAVKPNEVAPEAERSSADEPRTEGAGVAESTPAPAPTDQGSATAQPTESGSVLAKSEEAPGVRLPSPPAPVCEALAAHNLLSEISAFCEQHRMSPTRFGRLAVGDPACVKLLRDGSQPRSSKIQRIRAFIADPPAEALAQPESRPRVAKPARRDPTSAPDTPLMDLVDRQRLNGQRHHAAIRRGQEREAAALVDAGVDPSSVKSTFTANAMRTIQRRREDEARQADPVEQAKLALQKRFSPVCSMAVYGGDPKLFMVGSKKDVTEAALLLMAGIPFDVKRPAKTSSAQAAPAATRLKPAEVAWCDQCEQRVSGARAAKCGSAFCKLKAEVA